MYAKYAYYNMYTSIGAYDDVDSVHVELFSAHFEWGCATNKQL